MVTRNGGQAGGASRVGTVLSDRHVAKGLMDGTGPDRNGPKDGGTLACHVGEPSRKHRDTCRLHATALRARQTAPKIPVLTTPVGEN